MRHVIDDIDVARAAHHWTFRYVENGVPLHDHLETTAGIGSWKEWCEAWSATADGRMAQAERARAAGHTRTAAELSLIAALEYHFAKYLFVHDPAAVAETHAKVLASYEAALPHLPWPGRLLEVPWQGEVLKAVHRTPSADGPHPTVLLLPGLDATKEELHRFSENFLARGMAVVVLDGPGQGEGEHLDLVPDYEQVAAAAVAAMQSTPEVDAGRLAVVGVSLGGYFAARAASVDLPWRAGVSVGGCYSFGEPWDALSFLTRQAFEVRSGATRDGADPRSRADTFTLDTCPAGSDTPFLVVHGGRDALFDEAQARKMAAHFGDAGHLEVHPDGNHVLHNLAHHVRPGVADWVATHLDLGGR